MKKMYIDKEDYSDGYYHFGKDVEDFPDAVFYVVWSRRGPGKTYSGLRYCYNKQWPMCYIKRTKDDVNFIMKSDDFGIDDKKNPYSPLNRDFGLEIKAKSTGNGTGIFYEQGEADEMKIIARCESFSNVKKVKGFEMSDIDICIMDEFIQSAGEVVRSAEGTMLLSLYMTILRDRQKRGRGPLKMALFSNTDYISTPITRELEIMDDMAEMNFTGEARRYLKDRKILLHHITEEECPHQMKEDEGIFAVMHGTAWADANLYGKFANIDFSNIRSENIKKYAPACKLLYKRKPIFIYRHKNTGAFYMTKTPFNQRVKVYDLEREVHQRAFYMDFVFDMIAALIEDKLSADKYSFYDLIVNYKQYYKV